MPVFTRASSVFIPAVPAHIGAVYDNAHRLYDVPLKFDRNASAFADASHALRLI
jgi:hypothetical protein